MTPAGGVSGVAGTMESVRTPPSRGPPSSGAEGSDTAAYVRGVVVVAIAVLIFVGLVRGCSFAPGAPEVDRVSERGDPAPRGTVDAGGQRSVHTGRRGEALWVTDVDGVRLLVTGDAPAPELTRLAEATLAARPLPR